MLGYRESGKNTFENLRLKSVQSDTRLLYEDLTWCKTRRQIIHDQRGHMRAHLPPPNLGKPPLAPLQYILLHELTGPLTLTTQHYSVLHVTSIIQIIQGFFFGYK